MKSKRIDIAGMHCTSCELLIEEELRTIPSVTKADVHHSEGCAIVYFRGNVSDKQIENAVKKAGYTIGKEHAPFLSRNIEEYKELGIAASVFAIIWAVASINGWFSVDTSGLTNYASLPVVFFIGLTAGISTCMALVGGLVLGASARYAKEHPEASALEKFTPHLQFNAGRIASFFLLGGVIGYIGSFMTFSPGLLGTLIIIVGLVMMVLGFQLLNIFPVLHRWTFTMPKQLSAAFGIQQQKNSPFLMGALTFFLPCGFTQAMQLYAMSTGNMWTGALTMGVFALGTAPGLLAVGGLSSVVKGLTGRIFFKFAGVVVIAMAVFNMTNGFRLTGGNVLSAASTNQQDDLETQIVKATYASKEGFQPKELTVTAGVPTRLEVEAFDNGAGCMGSIALPGLSKKIDVFKKGTKTVFEFTAPKPGEYTIACAMGIPHGTIKAV